MTSWGLLPVRVSYSTSIKYTMYTERHQQQQQQPTTSEIRASKRTPRAPKSLIGCWRGDTLKGPPEKVLKACFQDGSSPIARFYVTHRLST